MELPRSSGIVLHPTSLPDGRLGASAYAFVDWLAEAGQRWWQVLPLGPPDEVGSPYASASAFAASSALLAEPAAPVSADEVHAFRERNGYWAPDWEAAGHDLADQVRFEREWGALRAYARERNIRLIGDVPIYPAWESVDHRAHPELFLPGLVAGAPPDDLGPEGQHWGNPVFDWEALACADYRWWVERLRRTFDLVDLTRIDHFRGFAAFWAIPEGSLEARDGRWMPGPGAAPFREAERALGPLPVIAEDLGLITADVEQLRDELGFPGMAVLIWAFTGPADNPHRLENHRRRQVAYTSTHDTDTLRGAFPERDHLELIRLALGSDAALCMIPAQDVLGLGSEARMNRPGVERGNWAWRLEPGQLTAELAGELLAATRESHRALRYPNVLLQSFVTAQLTSELLRRELEPRGMDPRRFGVQSVIGAFGPITPTDLATRLGMAPATVSAWLRRLTEDGQARKLPHPSDGRSYLVELTDEGREEIRRAGPGFNLALERLERELGEAHEGVWEAGNRFEAALRAQLADPSKSK